MCLECADNEKIHDRAKRQRNISYMKKNDLDKYYLLKQQGICTYCKHEKAILGKTKCAKCLAKIRTKRQAKRHDIDRSERLSYGICYICGNNPVLPRKGVCAECYKLRLSAIKKCNSNRKDGFNEYWKRENNLVFGGKNK